MIDFCRLDACPRCKRNIDAEATAEAQAEGSEACPVCRGRPVRVLVLWNKAVEDFAAARGVRFEVAGEAAIVAAEILERPDVACGIVVRSAPPARAGHAPFCRDPDCNGGASGSVCYAMAALPRAP